MATNPVVRQRFPSLAKAAGNVAGPQLRNAATIGGNLCLDTRCIYYNQTEFWRSALGYCLKKDGERCHVTGVGRKCVAAHSADTPPVLIALGATVELTGVDGARELPVSELFLTDGIWNSRRRPGEIVAAVRIPNRSATFRQGYAKLRQRRSIDFPLLTVAVAVEVGEDDAIRSVRGVVTALGARPRVLTGWNRIAVGERLTDRVVEELADRARQQCRPLENLAADVDWRRAMLPVYVTRALEEARR